MCLCPKCNSEAEAAQLVGLFFLIILAHLGLAYKYKPFPLLQFKSPEVRLQTAGLNIHQACHKAHLQDEQDSHEYLCDAIRQSNEPQGQRESCSNAQGRDISSSLGVCSNTSEDLLSHTPSFHAVVRSHWNEIWSAEFSLIHENLFFASGQRNLDLFLLSLVRLAWCKMFLKQGPWPWIEFNYN